MTTAAFRAVDPLVDLSMCCNTGAQQLRTSGGLVQFRIEQLDGRRVMLPTRLITPDGSAIAELRDDGVTLRIRRRGLEAVLSNNGIFLGEHFQGELEPPTRPGVQRVVQAIITDGGLQRAFLGLARGLWAGTLEAAAATNTAVPDQVYKHTQATGTSYASLTRKTPIQVREIVCTTETIVEKVTENVYGWVTRITTALQQAQRCVADCEANHPVTSLFDWRGAAALVGCLGGCAVGLFVDIVATTWEVVGTIANELITTLTYCSELPVNWAPGTVGGAVQLAGIPSSVGKLPADEVIGSPGLAIHVSGVTPGDIQKAAASLLPALQCIAEGDWGRWDVTVPDFGIGFNAVPIGLEVCISKECFDTIRSVVNWDTVRAVADLVAGAISAGGVDQAAALVLGGLPPAVTAGIMKIAAAIGITVGQALALVLVILSLITYQLTAIVAQMVIIENLPAFLGGNKFENGICLRHPIIALGAIAVVTGPTTVGPFMAAQIAVHTPMVVMPR
jgi:hypothetical protein